MLVWDNLCIFKLITCWYDSLFNFLRFWSSVFSCSVKHGMAWRMSEYYFWRVRNWVSIYLISLPHKEKIILNKRLLVFKIILHIKSKHASPFNKTGFISFDETTLQMNSYTLWYFNTLKNPLFEVKSTKSSQLSRKSDTEMKHYLLQRQQYCSSLERHHNRRVINTTIKCHSNIIRDFVSW